MVTVYFTGRIRFPSQQFTFIHTLCRIMAACHSQYINVLIQHPGGYSAVCWKCSRNTKPRSCGKVHSAMTGACRSCSDKWIISAMQNFSPTILTGASVILPRAPSPDPGARSESSSPPIGSESLGVWSQMAPLKTGAAVFC